MAKRSNYYINTTIICQKLETMKKAPISGILLLLASTTVIYAQTVTLATNEGVEHEVIYQKGTIRGSGVILNDNRMIDYRDIEIISTDVFDAYDRAMRKADHNVSIQFTGDRSYYAQKLDKLQKNRTAANAAMGAGGLVMLLGALSGDRDLYNAGVITYGAGRVAEVVNTEKTLATQSQAIVEMEAQQKQMQVQQQNQQRQLDAKELEAQYRAQYGNENVDALFALMDREYVRSLALANVGEISKNPEQQLAAIWIKALNYAEQKEEALLAQEFNKILEMDPEVDSVDEAQRWIDLLLLDLEDLRKIG